MSHSFGSQTHEGSRGKMSPLADIRLAYVVHEALSIPIRITGLAVPCARCLARIARGEPPLPLHPCCAAHAHDGTAL